MHASAHTCFPHPSSPRRTPALQPTKEARHACKRSHLLPTPIVAAAYAGTAAHQGSKACMQALTLASHTHRRRGVLRHCSPPRKQGMHASAHTCFTHPSSPRRTPALQPTKEARHACKRSHFLHTPIVAAAYAGTAAHQGSKACMQALTLPSHTQRRGGVRRHCSPPRKQGMHASAHTSFTHPSSRRRTPALQPTKEARRACKRSHFLHTPNVAAAYAGTAAHQGSKACMQALTLPSHTHRRGGVRRHCSPPRKQGVHASAHTSFTHPTSRRRTPALQPTKEARRACKRSHFLHTPNVAAAYAGTAAHQGSKACMQALTLPSHTQRRGGVRRHCSPPRKQGVHASAHTSFTHPTSRRRTPALQPTKEARHACKRSHFLHTPIVAAAYAGTAAHQGSKACMQALTLPSHTHRRGGVRRHCSPPRKQGVHASAHTSFTHPTSRRRTPALQPTKEARHACKRSHFLHTPIVAAAYAGTAAHQGSKACMQALTLPSHTQRRGGVRRHCSPPRKQGMHASAHTSFTHPSSRRRTPALQPTKEARHACKRSHLLHTPIVAAAYAGTAAHQGSKACMQALTLASHTHRRRGVPRHCSPPRKQGMHASAHT